MLIFSEERLVPTDVNMMVIKAKDESGYFYIHRALYDQAVIIYDIYGENPESLILALTGKPESREDVDFFLENAPMPINILGVYLLLVKDIIPEFVDMIGAIHVMSGPLHLRNMLKVPFEMRNSIPTFSLSIREEYQLAWDRFLQNTMKYSDDMFTRHYGPMSGSAGRDAEYYEEEEETDAEEDALAFLMDDDPFGDMDDFMADALKEKEESTPTEAAVKEEPAPVVVESKPEPEPEVEEEPQDLVGALIDL